MAVTLHEVVVLVRGQNFGIEAAVIGRQSAPRLWSYISCGVLDILTETPAS